MDEGSIISKALEIKRKSKTQFEHMHEKTTKEVEETKNSKGRMTILKFNKKTKEETSKCEKQCRKERKCVRGIIRLRFRNIFNKKIVSEVIKTIDSARNLEEYMNNDLGENGNMQMQKLEIRLQKI